MGVALGLKKDELKNAKEYVNEVLALVKKKNPGETEFHQAVEEVLHSLIPIIAKHPVYMDNGILERLTEPERLITFSVPWVEDNGKTHVNRGFRVQFNSALGPYKGGLRFHPSVNASIVKFLGFEQILKNSLTGQPLGAGKGGSDFDPKGKSDGEIMRFTQSFATELNKHIGPDTDIPAGDTGVGAREIGFMFGQMKRLRGAYEAGILTGKGLEYGGSLVRKEATGYGTVYFLNEMLKDAGLSLNGKRVTVSGSGNVSIYAMEKAAESGATIVACSDSDGYIYDPSGIEISTVKRIKEEEGKRISEYLKTHPGAEYHSGCSGIWSLPCDIALPCATQNEIDENDAQMLVKNHVLAVAEGANMPSTKAAKDLFVKNNVLFAPAKAANAGGVAVSSLEMAQNSMRLRWTFEEVDQHLQKIMKNIYQETKKASEEYGYPGDLSVGANLAGFKRVADALVSQGVV